MRALNVPAPVAAALTRRIHETQRVLFVLYGDLPFNEIPLDEFQTVTAAECEQKVRSAMEAARELLRACEMTPEPLDSTTIEDAAALLFHATWWRKVYHRLLGSDPAGDWSFAIDNPAEESG
jgi:hypothetical protein